MKKTYLLNLFLVLSCIGFAQHTNVLVSDKYAPNEPSIFIDPNNTNHIMAGATLAS